MKQDSQKLKSYRGSVDIVNNGNLQSRLLRMILIFFGFLALVYLLILGNMVFNIVARKSLESEARVLSNQVGDLELNYLAISNKVDLILGYSLGFKETAVKYATRKAVGAIKLANNEI